MIYPENRIGSDIDETINTVAIIYGTEFNWKFRRLLFMNMQ